MLALFSQLKFTGPYGSATYYDTVGVVWEPWDPIQDPNPPAFQITASGVALWTSNPPLHPDVTIDFSASGSLGGWDQAVKVGNEWVFPNPINKIAPFQESGKGNVSKSITVNLADYGWQVGWGVTLNVKLTATVASNYVNPSRTAFVVVFVSPPIG
jgi:hypothetical protein